MKKQKNQFFGTKFFTSRARARDFKIRTVKSSDLRKAASVLSANKRESQTLYRVALAELFSAARLNTFLKK